MVIRQEILYIKHMDRFSILKQPSNLEPVHATQVPDWVIEDFVKSMPPEMLEEMYQAACEYNSTQEKVNGPGL